MLHLFYHNKKDLKENEPSMQMYFFQRPCCWLQTNLDRNVYNNLLWSKSRINVCFLSITQSQTLQLWKEVVLSDLQTHRWHSEILPREAEALPRNSRRILVVSGISECQSNPEILKQPLSLENLASQWQNDMFWLIKFVLIFVAGKWDQCYC